MESYIDKRDINGQDDKGYIKSNLNHPAIVEIENLRNSTPVDYLSAAISSGRMILANSS